LPAPPLSIGSFELFEPARKTPDPSEKTSAGLRWKLGCQAHDEDPIVALGWAGSV